MIVLFSKFEIESGGWAFQYTTFENFNLFRIKIWILRNLDVSWFKYIFKRYIKNKTIFYKI